MKTKLWTVSMFRESISFTRKAKATYDEALAKFDDEFGQEESVTYFTPLGIDLEGKSVNRINHRSYTSILDRAH